MVKHYLRLSCRQLCYCSILIQHRFPGTQMSLTFIEPVDLCFEYGTSISVWMALHYFDRNHPVSSLQPPQAILPLRNFWNLGQPFERDVAVEYYRSQVRKRGIGLRLRSYPQVAHRVGAEINPSSLRCWSQGHNYIRSL